VKLHWQVLIGMAAGIALGLALQTTDATPDTGLELRAAEGAVAVGRATGPAARAGLVPGDPLEAIVVRRGEPDEERRALLVPAQLDEAVAALDLGDVLWLQVGGRPQPVAVPVAMDPGSVRAQVLAPFRFAADIFLALLKMLIVPIVFTSIVSGVASIGGGKELRRIGFKAFAYYTGTSLLAILVGQLLVNAVQPGAGARLGLSPVSDGALAPDVSFLDVLRRMVPPNLFEALGDNGAMLQIIFFALLLGYFITQTPAPHGPRVKDLFDSVLEVVMRLAEAVLKLIPYGVFALLVATVASTGFGIFRPLLLYMATVTIALLFHAGVTLPLLLRFVGRVSPRRWFAAMSPALITAFSTSSSSMTLPVTLETVEKRGRVSPKIASFTLPLGATVNMDGTALYECIGVIFLAQYYSSLGGFELTFTSQLLVIVMALLASIGAAGIPSAGLVMMLTILSALGLPLEGAALLLAVDRPLDMLRTTVNVWSDSCGAAIIARTEGDDGPILAPNAIAGGA
jgi:proton glutamate symport protein